MLKFDFKDFPVLETGRLLLRDHVAADAPALFEMRNLEAVMRYIPVVRPVVVADTEAEIERIHKKRTNNESLVWAIALKENPEQFIGFVGYPRVDHTNFRGEVGYFLHPDFWGKGYAGEALKAVVDFGFTQMDMHSIFAIIDPENKASANLLLKSGFAKEGAFRQDYYFNGEFLDSEYYAKLVSDPR